VGRREEIPKKKGEKGRGKRFSIRCGSHDKVQGELQKAPGRDECLIRRKAPDVTRDDKGPGGKECSPWLVTVAILVGEEEWQHGRAFAKPA